MANWASTSYRIEGNQKDLQELYNLCKDGIFSGGSKARTSLRHRQIATP